MLVKTTKNDTLFFEFETGQPVDVSNIYLEIHAGSRSYTARPDVIIEGDHKIILGYHFYKRGYFDLHWKMGDDMIATYTVSVNRKKLLP